MELNEEMQRKIKYYLSTLEKAPIGKKYQFRAKIEDYAHLGFTLSSILKLCQLAILAKQEKVGEYTDWDIYNLLHLAQSLVPQSELDFLDQLKVNIQKK